MGEPWSSWERVGRTPGLGGSGKDGTQAGLELPAALCLPDDERSTVLVAKLRACEQGCGLCAEHGLRACRGESKEAAEPGVRSALPLEAEAPCAGSRWLP